MPSLEEANDGEQEELDPEKQAKIAKAAAILEKMFQRKADEPADLEKCIIF